VAVVTGDDRPADLASAVADGPAHGSDCSGAGNAVRRCRCFPHGSAKGLGDDESPVGGEIEPVRRGSGARDRRRAVREPLLADGIRADAVRTALRCDEGSPVGAERELCRIRVLGAERCSTGSGSSPKISLRSMARS
jgi:hypothetical protein